MLEVVASRNGKRIGIIVTILSSEFISPFSKVILRKFSKAEVASLKN